MYSLSNNNLVSIVKYVSPLGIIDTKEKICLKCIHCRINDKYDMLGTKKEGYSFYPNERDAIQASDKFYVDRQVFNMQCSCA